MFGILALKGQEFGKAIILVYHLQFVQRQKTLFSYQNNNLI